MIKYKDPLTGLWVNIPVIPGASGLPAVTPEMFGAKGDGEADDSDAIRNAILNCGDLGTVYFSNKPYRITRSISVDRKINIEGRSCVIKVDAAKVTEPIPAVFHFTNQTSDFRTVIRDVNVSCQGKAVNGFRFGDEDQITNQITVDNCRVTGAAEDGFMVVPMAYCIRFQDCYAFGNGHSGISAVATSYSRQMNAVSIQGCTLIRNGRHGAHINGINIVVENCIIEVNGIWQNGDVYYRVDENNPGSGIFVGYLPNPSCSSVNIVVQNNYFEPSFEANITTCLGYASLRVLNNYFLVGGSRRPEGHCVTNVKCIQPVDNAGNLTAGFVSLIYKNNTSSGAEGEPFTDVDGGDLLTERSDIDAQYVANTHAARVHYSHPGGNKQYYPVPLAGENPYRSVNLVTSEQKSFTIHLPPLRPGAVLYSLGFSMETEGYDETIATKPVIRVGIKVEYDGQVLEKTFDHGMDPGTSEKAILMENREWTSKVDNTLMKISYLSIPRNARVSLTFTLVNPREASKIVIYDPYISFYHS